MYRRRLLVVTAADGDRSEATLFLERFLSLVVDRGRVHPVLFLGRGGDWSPRITGHGTVVNGDDLDDWWGTRFAERLGWHRDHRQLRALRLRWWRLRLLRAPILAISGPLPPKIACGLPTRLRAVADRASVPVTSLPPAPRPEGPTIVGLGDYTGTAGVDLWLRTVYEMRSRGLAGRFVWFHTATVSERTDGIDHDRWHLGLEEVEMVEMVKVEDWSEMGATITDCSVLVLSARPGCDPLAAIDERFPGGDWAVRSGQVPVVGFAGTEPPVTELPGAVSVEFPDVVGMAGAAVDATRRYASAEVDALLDGLLAGAAQQ